ncbi:HAD family phosphatase [candidate division KSB1 bacterium]|nr:HAD family phosphatase [candidate division KSB1 bacterium]
MIQALLFDFDGVIAASFPFHFRAWQQVITAFDVRPHDMVIKLHEGQPARLMAQALFKAAGLSIPREEAIVLAGRKNEAFRKLGRVPVYPQAFEILRMAKKQGFKTAVVTGTRLENVRHVLGDEQMKLFDSIIQDGDYRQPKPNPEPYLLAAKRLSVPPQACLVVENAPPGITAAKKAGMFCVALKTTLSQEHLAQADVILKDHQALIARFDALIQYR